METLITVIEILVAIPVILFLIGLLLPHTTKIIEIRKFGDTEVIYYEGRVPTKYEIQEYRNEPK